MVSKHSTNIETIFIAITAILSTIYNFLMTFSGQVPVPHMHSSQLTLGDCCVVIATWRDLVSILYLELAAAIVVPNNQKFK